MQFITSIWVATPFPSVHAHTFVVARKWLYAFILHKTLHQKTRASPRPSNKMFYVIHLIDLGKRIVIPCEWIRHGYKILDRYMFYGIKKNQKHLCYYSDRDDAAITVNGKKIPNGDFPPDFSAPISNIYPCLEGTFYCRVAAFKCKHSID